MLTFIPIFASFYILCFYIQCHLRPQVAYLIGIGCLHLRHIGKWWTLGTSVKAQKLDFGYSNHFVGGNQQPLNLASRCEAALIAYRDLTSGQVGNRGPRWITIFSILSTLFPYLNDLPYDHQIKWLNAYKLGCNQIKWFYAYK